MNKLFTKIASLTLGLALVASAGALIGKGMEAKSVSASEAVAYTLDGTQTTSATNYSAENEITQNGVTWFVNGNVNQNPWRIGGNQKNGLDTAGTIRHVQSQAVVSAENITKVVITSAKPSKNAITPTNVSLKVGTSIGGSETSTLSNGSWAASVTFTKPEAADWSSKYFEIDFTMPANTTDTNKYIELSSVCFYYESSVARGEISIDPLDSNVLFASSSGKMNYTWNPLDSGASVASTQWISSDEDVLTIDNNGNYQAKAPGTTRITLNATDTNSENYTDNIATVFVSNTYGFDSSDNVAITAPGVLRELSGINTSGSTHYGEGAEYTTDPNGTYAFSIETGTVGGSLAFKHESDYLTWNSGNSLDVSNTITDNSSWYVVAFDDYYLMSNVADTTREIWWNNGSTSLRFACYTGKTPTTSGYNAINIAVIEEVPVRGTLEITSPAASTTVLKQGTVGELAFTWTPNEEAPSATISTYEWHSSNTDAISIGGDTFTAVAAGKSRLSLTATDSTGQEYSVQMSKDIEVVSVVTGTYEKVTSVSDGDAVALVCESDGTELSGITSSVGTYVFYETAPASVYDLTLEADGDYFALKNSEDKYLSWKSDANLELLDEATDKSYWSISFSEGNATISNKALDGETHRYLAWNHNSPRFAAYKTGQTAVQLYAPVTSYSAAVVTFAESVLNDLTCDASGSTAPEALEWSNLQALYTDTILGDDITALREAKAIEHEDPSTDVEKVQAAMAKYDYVVAKYGSETYEDFIGRNPAPLKVITDNGGSINNSTTSIVVVTIISLVSISSIAVLLVIKKRKHN